MLLQEKTRDLARSLVASATDASATSLKTKQATVRVYEKLRRQLGAPVGVGGFRALASRALALAKSESPRLIAVQIMANGELRGLGEVESLAGANEHGEAGVILIAQLLGLKVGKIDGSSKVLQPFLVETHASTKSGTR